MDILHLPPALRRVLITHSCASTYFHRSLSSQAPSRHDAHETSTPPPPPPLESLLTLSSSTLNSYNLSPPPQASSLKTASSFFTRQPPTLLFSAAHFRSFPPSPFPEVAFLGRSNVGKSSLLNALLGRPKEKPAHVSKRPGRTKTMNGFAIGGEGLVGARRQTKAAPSAHGVDPAWKRLGRGALLVVDMPGYGAASRDEWGAEILKYLAARRQLRRTYVLVDTEHGLKDSDLQLLLHLRQQGIAHQIVLSKVDKLLFRQARAPGPESLHRKLLQLRERCAEIRDRLNRAAGEAGGRNDLLGDILCCSAEKSLEDGGRSKSKRIGIDELRWSVLTACGLEGDAPHRPATGVGEDRVSHAGETITREETVPFTP